MTDREALTWLQAMMLGQDMGSTYNVQRTQNAFEVLSSAINYLQDLHTRYTESLRANTTLANNNAELSMNCKDLSKELREVGKASELWSKAFGLQYEDNVRQRAINSQRCKVIEELENELDELSMLVDSRRLESLVEEVRRLTTVNAGLASELSVTRSELNKLQIKLASALSDKDYYHQRNLETVSELYRIKSSVMDAHDNAKALAKKLEL